MSEKDDMILFSSASRILSFVVLSPEDLEKPTDDEKIYVAG